VLRVLGSRIGDVVLRWSKIGRLVFQRQKSHEIGNSKGSELRALISKHDPLASTRRALAPYRTACGFGDGVTVGFDVDNYPLPDFIILLSAIVLIAIASVCVPFRIRGELVILKNAWIRRGNHIVVVVVAKEIIAPLIDGLDRVF
jgi:hypothetical protein